MTSGPEPAALELRARRIAIGYAVAASLWILGSDWLVAVLVSDPGWRMQASAMKGWVFVALTAVPLYGLLRGRAPAPRPAPLAGAASLRRAPLVLGGALVIVLTAAAMRYEYTQHVARQAAELEAVGELRAQMMGNWIKSQLDRAEFVRTSVLLAGLYRRGVAGGDEAARGQLIRRLDDLRQAFEQGQVMLLDAQGEPVAGAPRLPDDQAREQRVAALQAVAQGATQTLGPHADPAQPDRIWYDVIVPLSGGDARAPGVVVLRSDAGTTMLGTIAGWPVPHRSAASTLVRRDGDVLLGVQGRRPLQLSTPGLLVARVLRGEMPFVKAGFGLDSRGVEVFGAVVRVTGSDWILVSRIDAAELRADSLKNATWIGAAGALALFGLVAAGYLGRERRALVLARDAQRLQAERLHALGLVQAIAEASSDAIFAKDLEGRYLLCNREASRLIGVAVERVLGVDDRALFPADQAAQLRTHDARVLVDNVVRTYEETLTTSDGERVFLATKGPLHDEQGRVVGMFGISRDVTERVHERAALADSENTQRVLLEAMADGMFVAQDHRFLFANPALPRMLARDPAGFVDVPFAEVVAPEALATWTERFEARVSDGPEPEGHYEVQFLRAGGRERIWVDLRATRMDLHGRRAVLGLVTDITERRQAAQALAHATGLLGAIQDSLLHQMAVLDRDGRITAVNEAWRRFARENGGADDEAGDVGRDYLAVCGDDALGLEVRQGLKAVLAGESAHFGIEYPCHSPDRERWFQLSATPLSTQEGGAVIVHSDVTELRQANTELDRHRHRLQELVDAQTVSLHEANAQLLHSRDHAEAANRAKSAFLANMSHEIRTPMNAILGLTHLLRRDATDTVQCERLRKVSESASHLLEVINDVLDLSKIESGQLRLETADFSLAALLANARAQVEERASAKGLALSIDSQGVPDALRGDPTRLTQALLNLLSNAVKFTAHGGVSLRVELLARDGEQLQLRFTVNDSGIGIAADKLGSLFEPFMQADTSTTRRYGGTGLGLAITQRLAMQMGGAVGVVSEPGVGSRFWFTAALTAGQPAVVATPAGNGGGDAEDALRRHATGRRVLLVEDNPINQEVANELLQTVALNVTVAHDGVEALAAAERQPFDLVLMDMQMPVMDGLEATRRLRAMPATRHVPIIAMTANAFDEDRAACLAAGMDDHVAKPVDPDRLYRVLRRWIDAKDTPDVAVPAAPAREAALPPIRGVDPDLALRHAGGRVALLRRVLRQFAAHYADGLPALDDALEHADAGAAARAAHSLKGAAAAIGATRVLARTEALEAALAQAGSVGAVAAQALALRGDLQAVVEAIGEALADTATTQPVAARVSDAELEQLALLLDNHDFEATMLYRRLRGGITARDAGAGARIDVALASFDFATAAPLVRALLRMAAEPS